jgi:hypothetical protein
MFKVLGALLLVPSTMLILIFVTRLLPELGFTQVEVALIVTSLLVPFTFLTVATMCTVFNSTMRQGENDEES